MYRLLIATLVPALLIGGCNKDKKKEAEEEPAAAAVPAEAPGATPAAAAPKRPPRPGKPELPAPSDVAAAPAGAEKSTTGLASSQLEPATGTDKPRAFDRVKIEYAMWTATGEMLDRSREGRPSEMFLHQLIPGWSEALQAMSVGERRRVWIPESLGYGNQPGAPKGQVTMELKLLSVERVPEPPKPPADVKEAPADAGRTPSGLASKVLKPGTGKKKPEASDTVKVHYTGWTTDGRMFDSSIVRGEPMEFGVKKVIPGWSEGVQLMVIGEQRRLWIPEALAYQGRPGAPPGMLVFDIELVEIQKPPEPPKVPSDVKAAPASAKKTASGLASKVLAKGKGTTHPTADSQVEVHYSGWTTDGKMFDSSVTSGKPITFGLGRVIAGWTEGVQLMVEGEKRRLWIPEALAYQGRPGAPAGMLVFDIELLRIIK